MKPVLFKTIRRLFYVSPLALVIVCFQNFDENSIVDQMRGIKVEEKTHLLHATTLSGAAEEIFVENWAPEARIFTQKMGEKVRFGFSRKQYDGATDINQMQYLEPEMRMQVLGSQEPGGASFDIVNIDRFRLAWTDAQITCDYNPFSETIQLRTPLSRKSNLQLEHQNKDQQGRLSWQMSW